MKIYNTKRSAFIANPALEFVGENGSLEVELFDVTKDISSKAPHLTVREKGFSDERIFPFINNKAQIRGLEVHKAYELVLTVPKMRIHVADISVCDGGGVGGDYVIAEAGQDKLLAGLVAALEEIASIKEKLESHVDGAEII